MITEEQREEALEVQKTDKRHLDQLLISLGYLNSEELARALSLRLNVERHVTLDGIQVDPEVSGT